MMCKATDYNTDIKLGPSCGNYAGIGILFPTSTTITERYVTVNLSDKTSLFNPTTNVNWFPFTGGGFYRYALASLSPQIHSGDLVHVGISTPTQSITISASNWLNPGNPYTLDTNCPTNMSVNMVIHTKGKNIQFSNATPNLGRYRQTFIVENATVEFYGKHQPLKSLNATTKRKPMSVAKLDFGKKTLKPGQSFSVSYQPPQGAKYAVFEYTSRIPFHRPTHSWVEFELH